MHEDTATSVLEQEVDADIGLIRIVSGPDAGAEHVFTGRAVTVGSGPTAELRLTDPTVSRLHAELTRDGKTVRLRDLGSKNGTWLAGCRVMDVQLAVGAQIRLGSTAIEAKIGRQRLKQATWIGGDQLGPLIGGSPAMHSLFAIVAKIAGKNERVLIRGESGTGKELVARAIHQASPRRAGPFVVVDGASISRTLADLELFGHVQGAFTGAEQDRPGAFERAQGGTIFLDEIGDVPIDVQPKLLRAIEEGTVQRLGDVERRAVDVRVIAASNRELSRMINDGTFREDLLYRLGVIEIEVPPLRERGRDTLLLARAFVQDLGATDPKVLDGVERALGARAGYPWPGNVRELRSFVRRVVALGEDAPHPGASRSLDPSVRVDLPYKDAKQDWIEVFERLYLSRLLDETGGNVSEASRRAGLNRTYLNELLDKLRLIRR